MIDIWADRTTAGNRFDTCLVDVLTRAHIAQYAGASGDFNSVHVDETFAVAAGRPSVIAHGMLTMGLVGTYLRSLVGRGTLTNFGGRFLAPVVPGHSLRCTVWVEDLDATAGQRTILLGADAFTGDGIVFRGTARAVFDGSVP